MSDVTFQFVQVPGQLREITVPSGTNLGEALRQAGLDGVHTVLQNGEAASPQHQVRSGDQTFVVTANGQTQPEDYQVQPGDTILAAKDRVSGA